MMLMTIVRTILGYILGGLIGLFCLIPCFFIACLPERLRYDNRVYYWFADICYKGGMFATFCPLTIRGKENMPNEPAVFVANHQSSLDIPMLGSILDGHPHVWLFLKRYAHVPIFGFIARRMNIVVDHSGLRKLVSSIEQAIVRIKDKKRHVLIFPEGGRYIDGRIHTFFNGFALIAKETGRPVVPVFLRNIGKVYPPGSILVHKYPLEIIIGKPFSLQEGETESDFVERVRNWFVQQCAEQ